MAFKAGKRARVKLAGAFHRLMAFDVEDEIDEVDTTNFESNGKRELEDSGIEGANVFVRGQFDVGNGWLAAFTPGTEITAELWATSLIRMYQFPTLVVLRLKTGAEVRGKITFELFGKSDGTFTREGAA